MESLSSEVREMQHLITRRSLAPPTDPPRLADAEAIDRLIARLDDRIADLDHHLQRLDQRITAISTELANQIAELGSDTAPAEPTDTTALSEHILSSLDGTLDELRAAQVHLAAEQTRYQIALREDLARLASRLKA